MALAAGFGGFVGLRRPRDYPGGVRSLGYYFGKYLLKDYGRTMGGVVKLVTSSVAWKVGWVRHVRDSLWHWVYAGPLLAGWRLVLDSGVRRGGSRAVDPHGTAVGA